MFGKKMDIRKKALEAMDGGEMEIQIKKKPMPAMPSEEGMEGVEAKEGYEQMMVSEEEKAMIMKMRGEGGEEEASEEMEGMGVEIETGGKPMKSGAY